MKKKLTIVLAVCLVLIGIGIIVLTTKTKQLGGSITITSEYTPYQVSVKNEAFFQNLADTTIRKQGYYDTATKTFVPVQHIRVVLTPEEQPLYKVMTDGKLSNASNYTFQDGVLTLFIYIEPNIIATNVQSANELMLHHTGMILLSLSNNQGMLDGQGKFTKPYQEYFDTINTMNNTSYPVIIYK